MKKIFLLAFASIFLVSTQANSTISEWKTHESKGVKTRALASLYEDPETGEERLIAAIEFKISKGWQIYGHGAEGVGISPKFDLSYSKNYESHKVFWPKPILKEESIGEIKLRYFIYKDEVVLPLLVKTKSSDQETNLLINATYGLCKEVCIAIREDFSIDVGNKIDEQALKIIQKFYDKDIGFKAELEETESNIKTQNRSSSNYQLLYILLFGLIGGAILNIMPCVLPVLSIKLISIINHANAEISRIRFAFLSTILGILFCFVIFAALATIIKLTGNSFGWGLQFQNPYFLIFLAIILVLFIANLLGVFEVTFNQFISNLLNKKITEGENSHNIFIPNFLSGILAVLLATPCSAPFLGSAISFALTQNFLEISLVFLAIGVGFALPYIILLISPKLVYLLPKPGKWMNKTKQWMAGLLVATLIWIIHILSKNIGFMPAILVAILSLVLIRSLKIKTSFIRYFVIVTSIIAIFCLPIGLQYKQEARKAHFNSIWQNLNESSIQKHVAKGRVVVVDVTAQWCITCKFNKIRVLQDKEVMEILKSPDIIAMRGDLTKPNEKILNFLKKHNRYAIPFNIVFGPSAKEGILTSELLTKKELLEAIEKAR